MKTTFRRSFLCLTLMMGMFITLMTNAYADDCISITTNAQWNKGFEELQVAVNKGDNDRVTELYQELSSICSRSPSLNYLMGMAYKNAGQNTRALEFIILATRNTAEFDVDQEFARRIWAIRYELEHPDVSDKMMACQTQLGDLIEDGKRQQQEMLEFVEEERDSHAAVLWTGFGLGLSGLLLVATGGALIAVKSGEAISPVEYDYHGMPQVYETTQKINDGYITGWVLTGVGIGAVVSGAIMMGLGGSRYIALGHRHGAQAMLEISPTGGAFHVTF